MEKANSICCLNLFYTGFSFDYDCQTQHSVTMQPQGTLHTTYCENSKISPTLSLSRQNTKSLHSYQGCHPRVSWSMVGSGSLGCEDGGRCTNSAVPMVASALQSSTGKQQCENWGFCTRVHGGGGGPWEYPGHRRQTDMALSA